MQVAIKIIRCKSGSDIYFKSLYHGLKKAGYDVDIYFYPYFFLFLPKFIINFFNVDKKKYDLIHSNIEYAHLFKKSNTILICSLLHNVFDSLHPKKNLFQKIYHFFLKINTKKSIKMTDGFIAISEYSKKSFQKTYDINDIQVIYPSLSFDDYQKFSRTKQDKKSIQVFYVGNISSRKGFDILKKIIDKLNKKIIIKIRAGLKNDQISNNGNIVFLPRLSRDNLLVEYAASDIFLSTSRLEGFGLNIAEAMAAGLPIVASNSSSIPELVDEKGGILCQPQDIKAFIQAINKLANDNQLRKKMGEYNRKKILSRFNELYSTQLLKQFYSNLKCL